MGKSNFKQKHYNTSKSEYKGALKAMLPPALMAGIVPLLMREYEYETGLTGYAWYSNPGIAVDFFLGWKSVAVTVLAFLMAVCVAVRLRKTQRKIEFAKLFLPLFAYGVLAFLSACFSINRSFSFFGGFEHFETVWVLLGYVLVVYYTFLFADAELKLQVVADALCLGASVIGILGALQGVGLDLFTTVAFQKLITTEELLQSVGGSIAARFADNNATATLYNPNYMGVYCSLLVPFLAVMLVFEKSKWRRIWHGGNLAVVIVALVASRSRAGLLAAVAAVCVVLVFAAKKLLKWWYLVIPAVNLAVVLVLLVNAYNDNAILERFKNIFAADNVVVAEEIAPDGTLIRKTGLTELYTETDGVAFTYNGQSMKISLYTEDSVCKVKVTDASGKEAELLVNEETKEYTFLHPALEGVKLTPGFVGEQTAFLMHAEDDRYFVYNETKGTYQYITDSGMESDMIMAESFGFKNHQNFFSGRGYIWSRTLPLLKEHIFLGSGPDTFVLEFPQEDYLRLEQTGFSRSIMTKPHSWYLQVAVQTGVLSLLCLLAFYVWYAVQSLRMYAFRKLSTQTEALGMAAFIGSIGYMISGISNDSMVVTAPVFWAVIGLGVAANFMVKKQRSTEQK